MADSLKLERERIVNERRRQVEIKKRERERAKIEKIRQNQERRKLALNQKIALAKKREMEKKQPRKEKKNEKNKTMGILNSIFDHFEKAEFSISPNKKLKTLSRDFQKAFGLSLVFYKGNIIAEDTLTLAALNNKSSATIFTKSTEELKIRASMKVGNVEELFLKTFGVTVQIKNTDSTKLIDNKITLGDAVRNSN